MNREQFCRTALLLGEDEVLKLEKKWVAVFGVGGVGGFAVEALARSGVGKLDIFDNDIVALSNLNRQIIELHSTIGRAKVQVMKERILDINPEAVVNAYQTFYLPENADQFDLSKYDYIIDAVDTVTAKLELVVRADQVKVPIISSMGAGNKLDPTQFEVTDIYKTSICPLAKVMRRELKARNISKLKVVYSKEVPQKPKEVEGIKKENVENPSNKKRSTPGSIAFVPSVAGLILAGEVIKQLTIL